MGAIFTKNIINEPAENQTSAGTPSQCPEGQTSKSYFLNEKNKDHPIEDTMEVSFISA
jgi:hypothetical protein